MNTELMQVQNVPTKADVEQATSHLIGQVEQGTINPLFALGVLTAYEKAFSDAKKAVVNICVTAMEKSGEKKAEIGGAAFLLKESGVRYDFTDDEEWRNINAEIEEKKALLKGRETVLRQLGYCTKFSLPTVSVTLGK